MNLLYDINLKTEYQELYETIYGTKKPNRLINFAKGRLNACGK